MKGVQIGLDADANRYRHVTPEKANPTCGMPSSPRQHTDLAQRTVLFAHIVSILFLPFPLVTSPDPCAAANQGSLFQNKSHCF